jgi:hypothetical protein
MTNAATTRSTLIDRVNRSWDDLRATVDRLDEGQLSAPGPEGWSVKDHLAHLARWEEYALSLMDGGDGKAALGMGPEQEDVEDINAVLQRRDAGLAPAEVRELLEAAQRRVVARLETLDEAVLERHLGSIESNTHEHLDEHAAWIRELV